MKRTLLSVLAVLTAVTMLATPRSANDAQSIAKQYLTKNRAGLKMAKPSDLRLAHTASHNEQPAFYVFNNGDNAGFILISADDQAREVLGYAASGSFDENNMPANMKVWFQHYAEEVAYAAKHQAAGEAVQHQTAKRSYTPVAPLLTSKWDQGKPYNDLCPIDKTDNKRSYTGCVATAAAQIMYYHKFPTKGTGSHTNNWDNKDYGGKGSGSETANFGETTYDWANMIDDYSGSYTEAQGKAVATLMYHVGISCDMVYGSDKVGGSGAFTGDMAKALYTYFGYDKGLRYIMKDNIGYDKFEELFLAELAANRPILMGGATKNNEGHEFVCDGVNEEGYFHINWGWGGSSDSYFVLSALDPEKQGAGGAASGEGFSIQVEAVIGIQPDKGNPYAAPLVDIEPDEKGKFDYKFSKTAALKNEAITFSTEQAYNSGPADVSNAPIRYAVYKTDSTFVKVYGSGTFSMPAGGGNYQSLNMSASFDGLPAGEYLMALAFRMSDTQDWTPIAYYGIGEYCTMHVTADSVYIGTPQGGGSGTGSELVVDYAFAEYDSSDKTWTLVTYDSNTYEPWVQFSFNSGSANKIAGTYDLAGGAAAYWPDANNEDYVVASVSGQLKLKCISAETSSNYAAFEIRASWIGEDDNEYTLNADLYVPAQNDNEQEIELKDETGSEDIENMTGAQVKAVKIYRNGVLMIECDGKVYDFRGNRL